MKKMIGKKGQGIMEYIIITGLVGVFCLVAMKEFGQVIDKRAKDMKARVTKNLEIKR